MECTHVHLLPIFVAVWFPFTFIVTYCMAVMNNDVTPIFPYISDTGNWEPTSCVFGIMLTIGGMAVAFVFYVRYRQIRMLCDNDNNNFKSKIKRINRAALFLGLVATFGMLIVGNFQETKAIVVHLLGANVCFGGIAIYQVLQIVVSFEVFPALGKKPTIAMRTFFCALVILSYVICNIFGLIALTQFKGNDVTKWSKQDGGYTFHLISTIFEWIMAISNTFFLLTFSGEFRLIKFKEPEILENS